MASDLVGVTIVGMKHCNEKQLGEEKGLFLSQCHITVHHQKQRGQELTQGRNQEAGDDAEAVEGCCSLACSHGLLIMLSYKTQDQPA